MNRNLRLTLAASTILASAVMPSAIQRVYAQTPAPDPATVLAELQASVTAQITALNAAAAERATADTERAAQIAATIAEHQAELDRLNTALAAARLNGSGDGERTAEQRTYSQTFARFFRAGDSTAESSLRELAVSAAMTTQSDPDGGYLVPVEMEQAIDRVLGTTSVMRQIAQIQPISSGEYKKQVSLGGAGSGWVGETDARPATGTPTIAELTFTPGEIYAKPQASQTLLDDARVNLETWLAGEVDITFAEQEGAAFVSGNGIKKPRGLLDYDTVADATYAWGKLGFIVSGGATTVTLDGLTNLVYSLKAAYRSGAVFLMNRKTVGEVRNLKDGENRPLWQPSIAAGQPSTLMGYPVYEDDNMPDIGAGAYPIAFGNFRRGYLIVDRMGVRVLRDPYSSKPYVEFYTTKRVGGGVQDFAAIKLMKVAAS